MTSPSPTSAGERRSTVIHQSTSLRAVLSSGGEPSTLIVTFDSLNHDKRLDRPGFGQPWLEDRGYDAVHVTSSDHDWYQLNDTDAALARIKTVAGAYSRVFTYGSSMGGYAAVRFAARVGAQVAVALSPQFSIDPVKAPFEYRWAEHSRRLPFHREAITPEDAAIERAYVFYDPRDLDARHVDLLAQRFPVHRLPVPYGGHPVGGYLAETGLLSTAVEDIFQGRFEPAALVREARSRRRRSAQYFFTLSLRQPAIRRALAIRLAEHALGLAPHASAYLSHLATLLEDAGQDPEVERMHLAALDATPGHPLYVERLGAHYLRRGRVAEAAGLGLELARLTPANASLREGNARVQAFFGHWKAAAGEAKAAHRLTPSSRALLRSRIALTATAAFPPLRPLARLFYQSPSRVAIYQRLISQGHTPEPGAAPLADVSPPLERRTLDAPEPRG